MHRQEGRTQRTETSQEPEERTSTETPLVVASERGSGQWPRGKNRKRLERRARAGDSPVRVESLSRSEEHTSELQSLMRISYAVFCLTKKQTTHQFSNYTRHIQHSNYTILTTIHKYTQ